MNWKHQIHTIKKMLERNGFKNLSMEILVAEINGGKNANAVMTEVISKLAEIKKTQEEAYNIIITEAEALRRFAKGYGIEPK